MLAIQIDRTGGPDVLEPKTLPDPEPGPGQIRIRHGAIGLNFIETYQRSGLYPMALPKVLGQEGAGTWLTRSSEEGDGGFTWETGRPMSPAPPDPTPSWR